MLENEIFNIKNEEDFDAVALKVFQYQYNKVSIYREFCDHLKINVKDINSFKNILPKVLVIFEEQLFMPRRIEM